MILVALARHFSGMGLHAVQPSYSRIELSWELLICHPVFWKFFGLADNIQPKFDAYCETAAIPLASAKCRKVDLACPVQQCFRYVCFMM